MDVTVDPDMSLLALRESLEKLFDIVNFGVELHIWVDPLAVQVNTSNRVSVVTTDDSVRIQHRNQDEGVELPQKLGLLSIRTEEIKDSLEDCAGRGLPRVHSGRYDNRRLPLNRLLVPGDGDIPQWQSACRAAHFCALVIDQLTLVLKLNAVGWMRAIPYLSFLLERLFRLI